MSTMASVGWSGCRPTSTLPPMAHRTWPAHPSPTTLSMPPHTHPPSARCRRRTTHDPPSAAAVFQRTPTTHSTLPPPYPHTHTTHDPPSAAAAHPPTHLPSARCRRRGPAATTHPMILSAQTAPTHTQLVCAATSREWLYLQPPSSAARRPTKAASNLSASSVIAPPSAGPPAWRWWGACRCQLPKASSAEAAVRSQQCKSQQCDASSGSGTRLTPAAAAAAPQSCRGSGSTIVQCSRLPPSPPAAPPAAPSAAPSAAPAPPAPSPPAAATPPPPWSLPSWRQSSTDSAPRPAATSSTPRPAHSHSRPNLWTHPPCVCSDHGSDGM